MNAQALPLAELEKIAYQSYVDILCMVAPAGLIAYEHAITLAQEVDLLWSRKFNHITALFCANRVFAYIYVMATWASIPYGGTEHLFRARSSSASVVWFTSQILLSLTWAAFSALRVRAVSGGTSWRLPAFVFLMNMVIIAMNLRLIINSAIHSAFSASYGNAIGALVNPRWSSTAFSGVIIASRACNILADLIVLAVTWRATYGFHRSLKDKPRPMPLARLLMRDGAMYFVAMSISNVVAFVIYIISLSLSTPYFTYCLQSIIISRFLIHIREEAQHLGSQDVELSEIVDDTDMKGVGMHDRREGTIGRSCVGA